MNKELKRAIATITIAIVIVALLTAMLLRMKSNADFFGGRNGQAPRATANPQKVGKDDFGHTWNLTVDSGEISCTTNKDGDLVTRFKTNDGKIYGISAVPDNDKLPSINELAKSGKAGPIVGFATSVCSVKE